MKKRPTAFDRDVADVLRKLIPGNYDISVEDKRHMQFMSPPPLKVEGATTIDLDEKRIHIVPRSISKAA